jgi:hypothetical protein
VPSISTNIHHSTGGKGSTYPLVRNRVCRVPHQLLDVLDAAHLGVDLAQHARALLQAEHDVLLDQRELDARRQLLELRQLRVRLGEERLLVLLAAQGEQRALLVVLREHGARDGGFAVGQDGDAPLVLVEAVALGFEVEDSPGGGRG